MLIQLIVTAEGMVLRTDVFVLVVYFVSGLFVAGCIDQAYGVSMAPECIVFGIVYDVVIGYGCGLKLYSRGGLGFSWRS